MDDDTLHPIGELARRTGLTVKTVRYYSDRGIVTPAARSPAGYRLYTVDAVARLRLVRTLRDLGLDLPTIAKVMDRELSLPEVAAVHAEALAVRISALRLRRAVLRSVARRGSTPEETDLMHRLAQLSEAERRALTGDFLAAVFGGPGAGLAGVMRSMTPELPDDPDDEQIQAWVELAALSQDPDFRTRLRQLAEAHTAESTPGPHRDLAATVRDLVGPALSAGIGPASAEAGAFVAALTAHYAQVHGRPDDPSLRRHLRARLVDMNDPRRERYLGLLAVVNGWPAPESPAPALAWSVEALRAGEPG